MNILACIKRVPATGGVIALTADEQELDTRFLGFTVSPHEECAVEEALRLKEAHGGSVLVLSLGPEAAQDQLRDTLAMGADDVLLLETDGREWDAAATAGALVAAVKAEPAPFDLLLFGNESADAGGYQVPVRVAHLLGLPCLTGVKSLTVTGRTATAKREMPGGWEVYEVELPAVISVKEGINLPRYPSIPGRLKAKRKAIRRLQPAWPGSQLEKLKFQLPPRVERQVEILGEGPAAAPKVVALLKQIGVG
ncbi:MAG: electron transfer flavoprotein subunit beta/FixA family protein [Anaerolineales bacterium]|nr:electron transfer flavoprotein subunit beta/FixA family protein [Anaerolineales bacterium]